jgi:hypothetical protein
MLCKENCDRVMVRLYSEVEMAKVDVREIGGQLASLTWVALRSFVGTMLILMLGGVILAGLSYYFVSKYDWAYGVMAAVLALVESVTIAIVLGAKRAVVLTLAEGLSALRLGRSLVGLIFERMLGVAAGNELDQSGGKIAQGLERLPLAQAQELLSSAVRTVTGDPAQGGWLRRKIQEWLLEAVRKYTLARFREEGATHGGVNLLKVKGELERTVDDALVQKVRGTLRLWTALVSIGLPLAVVVQNWAVVMLLRRRG